MSFALHKADHSGALAAPTPPLPDLDHGGMPDWSTLSSTCNLFKQGSEQGHQALWVQVAKSVRNF